MSHSAPDSWSATALDIQERMRSLRAAGEPAAVATVVAVEGSAYRRPGANMVLTPGGEQLGGITAGCLEGPVGDLAEIVFERGDAVLETFDLMDDEEWGLGLGCNGIIDVLVEPLDDAWDPALAAVEAGTSVATVTVLDDSGSGPGGGEGSPPLGARVVVTADGVVHEPADRPAVPAEVVEAVRDRAVEAAATGATLTTTVATTTGDRRLLVDAVEPPERLVVFGGQPDSVPLAQLARRVGFHVTVATPRGGKADPERFPAAHEVVGVRPPDLGELVDGRTAVAVMTHNLLDDALALSAALDTDAFYVGAMGPRDRFERVREELAGTDDAPTDDQLERVAAPVGLDLGGGAPVEIALSIVAEVVAVSNDREGGRLRERAGAIHEAAEAPPEE